MFLCVNNKEVMRSFDINVWSRAGTRKREVIMFGQT